MLQRLRENKVEFHTLEQIYEAHKETKELGNSTSGGRSETHSTSLHTSYWKDQTESERQETLRNVYNTRNETDPYATSRDHNQRELEIFAISAILADKNPGTIVDFGCGNGYTAISLAKTISDWNIEGIDFSKSLISGANFLLEGVGDELRSNVNFSTADAVKYIRDMESDSVDAVLTERFLLNLPSRESQWAFIREIFRILKPGGTFLMCEGSLEGLRGLNNVRVPLGLDAILENSTDNLSAIRFEDKEVEDYLEKAGFILEEKMGFSYFFAMSRALHPALVSPKPPTFDAKINDIARSIQESLPLSPGIGSNVLWVAKKR